jgi:hypothetical protein
MGPMSAAISNLVSRARPARIWFDFGKISECFVICEALKVKAFEHSKMANLNGPRSKGNTQHETRMMEDSE